MFGFELGEKLMYAFRGWIAFVAFMDLGTAFRCFIDKRTFLDDVIVVGANATNQATGAQGKKPLRISKLNELLMKQRRENKNFKVPNIPCELFIEIRAYCIVYIYFIMSFNVDYFVHILFLNLFSSSIVISVNLY